MDLEQFDQSLYLTARLVDERRYDDALVVLRPWVDSDLPDLNKCIACINLAVVYELKGQEADALENYDRAIEFERPHGRCFAAERKAAYLAGKGRATESLMIYEWLLGETSLTDEDRERIKHNISVLRGRPA